jgi:predicted site-specific integrase-resolvase
MKRKTEPPIELERDAYTPREVSQLMGMNEQTIQKWCREGRIPEAEKMGEGTSARWMIWKAPFDARRGRERRQAA